MGGISCPFGKNGEAGSWLIPSIIIETCFSGGFWFLKNPLFFHQPTNGNLGHLWFHPSPVMIGLWQPGSPTSPVIDGYWWLSPGFLAGTPSHPRAPFCIPFNITWYLHLLSLKSPFIPSNVQLIHGNVMKNFMISSITEVLEWLLTYTNLKYLKYLMFTMLQNISEHLIQSEYIGWDWTELIAFYKILLDCVLLIYKIYPNDMPIIMISYYI